MRDLRCWFYHFQEQLVWSHVFSWMLPAVETIIDLSYQLSSFDHEPMILPTYPRHPRSPPQRKKLLPKLLLKSPGYLPGVCGRDLRKSTNINQSLFFLGPKRWRISSHRAHRWWCICWRDSCFAWVQHPPWLPKSLKSYMKKENKPGVVMTWKKVYEPSLPNVHPVSEETEVGRWLRFDCDLMSAKWRVGLSKFESLSTYGRLHVSCFSDSTFRWISLERAATCRAWFVFLHGLSQTCGDFSEIYRKKSWI